MYSAHLNFEKISKALSATYMRIEKEQENDQYVLEKIKEAEKDLQKAIYFSLSSTVTIRND